MLFNISNSFCHACTLLLISISPDGWHIGTSTTLQVPRQTGDDSGIYVLFFIYCFLQNKKLGEDFSQLVRHTFH
jgi:hypothetical protein